MALYSKSHSHFDFGKSFSPKIICIHDPCISQMTISTKNLKFSWEEVDIQVLKNLCVYGAHMSSLRMMSSWQDSLPTTHKSFLHVIHIQDWNGVYRMIPS